MIYHLTLAGLSVTVQTPTDIVISDRFLPFVQKESVDHTDCTVTVQSCDVLPVCGANGIWNGTAFYETCGDSRRVFHAKAPKEPPFAVVEFQANGNVDVQVLPSHLEGFSDLSGIFNYMEFENWLLQHGGLLLHASLIEYKGRGILFAGPSGVGKSTQANLWQNTLGATILNGDRAVLRKTDEGWTAFGSPFAGTSGVYRNIGVPIAAIAVLHQSDINRFSRIGPADGLRALYPELSIHRFDAGFVNHATDLALDMVSNVSIGTLECLPNSEAVHVLKEGVSL